MTDIPRRRLMRADATRGRAGALRMWREDAQAWIREVQALGVTLD